MIPSCHFASERMPSRALLGLLGTALLCAACVEDPAPLFTPTGTGSVSGQIFFDIDGNAQFNPLLGDTLAGAGVTVQLRERGTTTSLATTATDANGMFSFSGVPVGTHEVFIPQQAATGSLVFCANPLTASVYIDENAFVRVPARNGCIIPIEDAEALDTGVVTIYGVITAEPGIYRSNNLYIQDFSGGTQVFGFANPANLTLARGDSVEIIGRVSHFNFEIQLIQATLGVTKKPGVVPAPVVMTAAEITALAAADLAAGRAPEFGKVVTVRCVTAPATWTLGTSGDDGDFTDATGTLRVRLDQSVQDRIPVPTTTFVPGQQYDITGILGSFTSTEQLKPRDLNDVAPGTCP